MKILLAMENRRNQCLISEWVGNHYTVQSLDTPKALECDFDLGIVDGPKMEALFAHIKKRKQIEGPVFLPFLLVTSRKNIRYVTRHLWRTVDEIILTPIEKLEFSARIEILLRARRLSVETQHLAITDPLTGIFNRRHFFLLAERELSRLRRSGQPASLVMLDIDHFKKVNDTLGHPAGDEAIRKIAACIRDHIREYDLLARYGGEEMVIMLPDTPEAKAMEFAERLRRDIAAMTIAIENRHQKLQITVSMGVAQLSNQETLEESIRAADQALYSAKRNGRNRVVAASAMGGKERTPRP